MPDAGGAAQPDSLEVDRFSQPRGESFPGVDRILAAWRGLPLVAQVFLVLALVDLAVRVLGIGGVTLGIEPSIPFTLVTAFLPHFALVLLPALMLWRRPDAADATPLLLQGAIAIALVELLAGPLLLWFPGTGADITGWTLLHVVAAGAKAAGYVALGIGLVALNRSVPSQSLAGLSNLVAGLIGGAAITSILFLFVFPPTDLGDPSWASQFLLVSAVGELALIAFAFLARAVIRGTGDVRRPMAATYLGASAVIIAGVNAFFVLGINVVAIAQVLFALSTGAVGAAFTLGWFGSGFVLTVLVVAFALGLGDTSVRIPGRGQLVAGPAEPEPEAVRWPTPGGEVPTFRPVATPEPAQAPPAPKRRRTRSKPKEPEA